MYTMHRYYGYQYHSWDTMHHRITSPRDTHRVDDMYSITYIIPDKVLRWLGGTQDNAGSSISAVIRGASSGLSQQAQSAAQGVATTTSSGLKG